MIAYIHIPHRNDLAQMHGHIGVPALDGLGRLMPRVCRRAIARVYVGAYMERYRAIAMPVLRLRA